MSTAGRHHLEQSILIIAKSLLKEYNLKMDYQVLINDNLILSGSLYTVILISILIVCGLWIITRIIWHKLGENEKLKYEFITIIAHKFRTPLTQTKWIVESMNELETDSFKKENLKNLGVTNEKLINLTNTLVELTDSKNGNLAAYSLERINLCELTNKVVNGLSADFHQKNIFFGVQCSEPEIYVKVDKIRMEFVIQTILENSIDYTHPGKNVDIIIIKKDRKAIVQVNDGGIGIAPSELPQIFTKFYRSDSAKTMDTEGFGISLFLAQSVAKRHGGKIEVDSEGLEKGASFNLILPLVK